MIDETQSKKLNAQKPGRSIHYNAFSLIQHWQWMQKNLSYKQHIFAKLTYNFNAVVQLARQKWFCHGSAAFDNSFQNKTRFSS